MPLPAHFDEGGEDSVDSGGSENNDEENDEE
jgi:hypothetical protein